MAAAGEARRTGAGDPGAHAAGERGAGPPARGYHQCVKHRSATLIHHGGMEDVVSDYEALVQWIDDSGYTLAGRSRELYRQFYTDKDPRNITELQMPITS